MKRARVTTTIAIVLLSALASAQSTPNFAGKWTLVPAPGATGAGGLGQEATIAQDATSITIKRTTQMGEFTTIYKLDGSENPVPGPLGWDTRASATRQDGRLVVTIKRSIDGPDGKLHFEIRDAYTVAGDVLTLERSQGSRTQKMVYKRTS